MKATLFLLTLLGAFSPCALAQAPLQTGAHVQIKAPRLAGRFSVLEITNDTLILRQGAPAPATRVPLHSVKELRIRQDRTPLEGATRGGTLGLLIGGGVGVLAGLAASSGECRQAPGIGCVVYDAATAAAPIFMGILGAGAGAFIGGLVGSVRPGERWVSVSVPMSGFDQ
jgi:hypothetical protein